MIVPVSAAILKDRSAYDQALEVFSRPLLGLIDYDLDSDGKMSVNGDTSHYYRYPDFTKQTEALARFITEAIERSLVEELQFLRGYDLVRDAVREVVDLPDNLLRSLLIFLRDQHGQLSAKKRSKHFSMLTDAEVKDIESAYNEVFGPEP